MLDGGELLVRRVLKEAPESLCRTYIPCLDVAGNLVIRTRDGNGHTVCPFIDVLIDILDRLNGSTNLDVNMRAELLEEVRVIGDHLAVIADDFLVWKAWFIDRKCPAIVPAVVLGIPVFADNSRLCKRLWEPLLARKRGSGCLTDHARRFRVID